MMEKITKKDILMGAFALLLFLGAVFYGCGISPVERLNEEIGLEDDHIFEELAESLIEYHMGIRIDLTPSSRED